MKIRQVTNKESFRVLFIDYIEGVNHHKYKLEDKYSIDDIKYLVDYYWDEYGIDGCLFENGINFLVVSKMPDISTLRRDQRDKKLKKLGV